MRAVLNEFLSAQFLRYAIIGISGVVLDFLIFVLLIKIGLPAVIASIISVSIAIVNNFFLNAYLNFKKKDHLWWRFLSFYAVGATGVILSALILVFLHDIIGMGEIYAKLVSVPFIVVFQYWFNKSASFAEDHTQIPWRQLAIFGVCISILVIFAINAPYYNFTDENDNLLGAQLIAQDHLVIYKDYFSHHMPLTYFVGTPLFMLLGDNLIAIKITFGLLMACWLLAMARHLLFRFGFVVFVSFTGLVAISQTLAWSHMLLAETLIAFALCHALILFITKDKNSRNFILENCAYVLLGAIPILSSLSYAPISILIYAVWLWQLIEKRKVKFWQFLLFSFIAALPYVLFLGYLYLTRSLSEFKEQALTFNTLYYSQFSPDAPTSITDSILSIPQGTFESLKNSLTSFTLAKPQPLSFFFSSSILIALALLVHVRKWVIAGFFALALFFGGSRSGFATTFSSNDQARAGIILAVIGVLLLCYVAFTILPSKKIKESGFYQFIVIIFATGCVLLSVGSIGHIATITRDYVDQKSIVELKEEPGSPSTVINIVNNKNDYYWIGPIDFSSQIVTKSENVSEYRFYPPWVGACLACTQELERDIANKKPRVIAFNKDVSIWGHEAGTYASGLIHSFEDKYYQLDDKRLQQFYFLKSDRDEINKRLEKAGYEL